MPVPLNLYRGAMEIGWHLREMMGMNRVTPPSTTEVGIIRSVNADGTYDVEIRGQGNVIPGLFYDGNVKLEVYDTVTVIFYQYDRQRPRILGPTSYRTGREEKIVEVVHNVS